MHWMTVLGVILTICGTILTVWGGKKEAEQGEQRVIGSVEGTGQTLATQNKQLQKSIDGLNATNETLLKAN
jgi:hypothetical protein